MAEGPEDSIVQDEEIDACDVDFAEMPITPDEDLPVTFGGGQ